MNEPMKQCSEFFGIPRKLPEFFSMNNSLVHLDLLDDNLDLVYDDDVAYEPIEGDDRFDFEDSFVSTEEEEDSDDESEQENIDE